MHIDENLTWSPHIDYLCSHIASKYYGSWLLTRGIFFKFVELDLLKTAKVNTYIMYMFGKIELLSIHAT